MKKLLCILLCSLLCIPLASCVDSSNDIDVSEPSVLEGNVYFGSWNSENAKQSGYYASIKFHSDGVVEWIHIVNCTIGTEMFSREDTNFKADKYYGTYEFDGRKLIIVLALSVDETFTCITNDDGTSITIAGENFSIVDKPAERISKMFD